MVTHAAIAVILKDIPPESEGFTFRRDFLFFYCTKNVISGMEVEVHNFGEQLLDNGFLNL